MKRICIDLDGVIASFKQPGQGYPQVQPIPGAVERLHQWKAEGHYLIIFTARHMKTCGANVGLVNARVTEATLAWLRQHNVPYDEIFFVKPWADIYIDDNALRFQSWDRLPLSALDLPSSNEST